MRRGAVGVALSVLYQPFDEMDLAESYGAPPRQSYFDDIVAQRETVEDYAARHPDDVVIAHSVAKLDELLQRDVPILIHAIEGGFALGRTREEIQRNVATLAGLGIAYVTVAHLFFRDVAANAPALPFLPDWLYNAVFRQRRDLGLTQIGHDVVDAMINNGILIDLTHMRTRTIKDVLAQLDSRDPSRQIPVIATHMAYRFGGLEYSFDDKTVLAIAERGGVLGCILCEHYITSGLRAVPRTLSGSVEALFQHIDKIHALTKDYDHIAIGSDLDGYIKPALPGLEHMGLMQELQRRLHDRYGEENANKITHGNALRILRTGWGQTPAGSALG